MLGPTSVHSEVRAARERRAGGSVEVHLHDLRLQGIHARRTTQKLAVDRPKRRLEERLRLL